MKRPDILISIDPSYKGCGVSILFPDRLVLTQVSSSQKIVSFKDCYIGSLEILGKLDDLLTAYGVSNGEAVIEIPPIKAMYAPGLCLLDGQVLSLLEAYKVSCFGLSCKVCSSISKPIEGKHKKIHSLNFVNSYISTLDIPVYILQDKKEVKLLDYMKSDDMAESFILLVVFSYLRGWGESVFKDFLRFSGRDNLKFALVDFNA